MADVIVLAEDTAQVAVGQKYGTRAVNSGEGPLLAMVRVCGAHNRKVACAAVPRFPFFPVDPALPGTKGTRGRQARQLLYPDPKGVGVHIQIGGDERFHSASPGGVRYLQVVYDTERRM